MKVDVAIVGGGLSGSLLAYRLAHLKPLLNVLLLEAGSRLGGEHTWCFHDGDLSAKQKEWVAPLLTRSWLMQRVMFPRYSRLLNQPYHAIRSLDFDRVIQSQLPGRVRLNTRVAHVEMNQVQTADGEVFEADCVVDARGWVGDPSAVYAFQKFVGHVVRLESPHGLSEPWIMDATIEQEDGYRFFYVLPWDTRSLMIEDTRYSDSPVIHVANFRKEIEIYARRRGWRIASVEYEEVGCLPIPLTDLAPVHSKVPKMGMAAGVFHATTGYSVPDAVRTVDRIADRLPCSSTDLGTLLYAHASEQWRMGNYFRFLNRLMFYAATAKARYRIFERFYRLPESVIRRFYAGELTLLDKCRILAGRPPVPVSHALRVIFSPRTQREVVCSTTRT